MAILQKYTVFFTEGRLKKTLKVVSPKLKCSVNHFYFPLPLLRYSAGDMPKIFLNIL